MIAMPALVRAELLALRTIRTTWALLAGAVLLTAVLAVYPVVGAGKAGAPSIGTAGALLAVLGAPGRGSLVAMILGVLAVTAEVRHRTLTTTFLRSTRRARVLVAKGAAVVLLAAAVAVADLVVALAVGLTTGAVQPSLLNADIVLRVLGLLLAYPLYGLIGVAAGALIGYQPVAVLLPVAWALVLEDLALHMAPAWTVSWSLGGVTAALANAGDVTGVLPMATGGAALLAYTLLLLALGAVRLARRDIT
jgi:ABC-2 type transport system permease protein